MFVKEIRVLCILLISTFSGIQNIAAQFTITPAFSVLKSADDDKPVLLGGGLQAGYRITPNIQLGLAYSLYPAKERDRQFDGLQTRYRDQASNIAVTATYFFLKERTVVRPLLGFDAGINFAKQTVYILNVTNNTTERSKTTSNILLAPKAGLAIGAGKRLSIIPEVQYHFSGQKRKQELFGYTGSGQPIVLSPIQSFYTLNVGIAIRI